MLFGKRRGNGPLWVYWVMKRRGGRGGDSCGGMELLGKRRGDGPLWVDWVMKKGEWRIWGFLWWPGAIVVGGLGNEEGRLLWRVRDVLSLRGLAD